MFARTISTPLETDEPDQNRPARMDRQRSSRIEKAREFVRRELQDMQLPSSCATAPQVDAERCSLTFAPENEDPDQVVGINRTWRKSAIRRRENDAPVCILCVSKLPREKSKSFYEDYLKNYTSDLDKDSKGHLGPIYPKYGSVFLSFWSKKAAFLSFRLLQEEMPNLRLNILPNINTSHVSECANPLLIFVNGKSGGGQGKKISEELRFYFSRHQVFELDEGGPLPGLFSYRHVKKFRILVCGGDGTCGWVMQCVEDLHQYMQCKAPPIAILPLGTGNDLSRVLGWGGGYTNAELVQILVAINHAKEVDLDRWNIMFDSYRKCTQCQYQGAQSLIVGKGGDVLITHQGSSQSDSIDLDRASQLSSGSDVAMRSEMQRAKFERQQTIFLDQDVTDQTDDSERRVSDVKVLSPTTHEPCEPVKNCDNCRVQGVRMLSMNNYMGIGLDAEITLEFHRQREKHPERFASRIYNKSFYFKSFLSQIPSKSKYINNVITLKAENEQINLPNVQGLIFINIPSWSAGADIWKVDKDNERWDSQDHSDGKLECVGLTGLTHLSNVFAGIRSGIRIAQASYYRLNLLSSVPVHVDGEPWEQAAGELIIAPCGAQARMLKKTKRQ